MTGPKELVSARVSPDTLRKIKEIAEVDRRSKSWIISEALEAEVDRIYRQVMKSGGVKKGKK